MNPWLIVIGIVAFIGLIESTHRSNSKNSLTPSSRDLQAKDEQLYAYLQKYPTASPTSQPSPEPTVPAGSANTPTVPASGSGSSSPLPPQPSPTSNPSDGGGGGSVGPVTNPYQYQSPPMPYGGVPTTNPYSAPTPGNTGGDPTTNTPSGGSASPVSVAT